MHDPRGSLTVIGTGIRAGSQLTPEARAEATSADLLLYLVTEGIADAWLGSLNPQARSLLGVYETGLDRPEIYERLVEELLAPVRAGLRVCAAFYGHPGLFVVPSHEAIRRAQREGFTARMLPAVSSLDCLVADLGVDPGQTGCQSYEANDFLLNRRAADPTAALVLWQVGGVGAARHGEVAGPHEIALVAERLMEAYPPDHEVVLYEASPYPVGAARIRRTTVGGLAEVGVSPLETLYVAPARPPVSDPAMAARLRRK